MPLKQRLLLAVLQAPDVGLLWDAGSSLCAVADNSIISSVAAFHMPALVTAALFNFHCSEVFNLSVVSFCFVKIKCQSPYLDFYPLRGGTWILYESMDS